jgi:hypothetical protein
MKVLIYATDLNHGNIEHLTSSLGADILPILLPWTMDFYPKSYSVYNYIKSLNSKEQILVCDAYDVIALNKCTNKLLEENILNFFNNNKVTFNAETNCYPDSSLAQRYPDTDSKWKYLNAGIYTGRVENVLQMLDLVLNKMVNSMDQLEFSKLFLDSKLINLDYECKVFQTTYSGSVGGYVDINDFIIKNGKIYNKQYDTMPLLFHGNGKTNMSYLSNISGS